MAALVWDQTGEKYYETGTDHGVLYPTADPDNVGGYTGGVVWNGLTGVTESPSGAEATAQYADNIKYLNLISAEEFGATITAFTYPDEFALLDGSIELVPGVYAGQQTRKAFGFSYRSLVGNDVDGQDHGYKLHLIYGALASPSERAYVTVNDSPEAIEFSWELTTTPTNVTGGKPTASVTIDTSKLDAAGLANLAALEKVLYGDDATEPRLPAPDEIAAMLKAAG